MRDRTLAKLEPGHIIGANHHLPKRMVVSTRRLAGGTVAYQTVGPDGVIHEESGAPRSRMLVYNPDGPLDLVAAAQGRGGYDDVPPGAQERLRILAAADHMREARRRAQRPGDQP